MRDMLLNAWTRRHHPLETFLALPAAFLEVGRISAREASKLDAFGAGWPEPAIYDGREEHGRAMPCDVER